MVVCYLQEVASDQIVLIARRLFLTFDPSWLHIVLLVQGTLDQSCLAMLFYLTIMNSFSFIFEHWSTPLVVQVCMPPGRKDPWVDEACIHLC